MAETGGIGGVVRLSPLERPIRRRVPKPALAKKLEAGGIHTVRDLLSHYPRRLIDPGELTSIANLYEGQRAVLALDIAAFTARPMRNRRGYLVSVELTDGERTLPTVYFAPHKGRVTYLEQRLIPGQRVVIDGVVRRRDGRFQITHPEIDVVDSVLSQEQLAEQRTRPQVRYPVVQGVKSADIAALIASELAELTDADLPDPVPESVRESRSLMSHAAALRALHQPEDAQAYRQALASLRFEEAFVLQAAMARRRADAASHEATARSPRPGGILSAFDADLPFTLTQGQVEVGEVIAAELASSSPMHRLLQGEVGSGKTLVALRAMLQVVDAGGQAALLAPTEVLAAQHERSIRFLLGSLGEAGMLGSGTNATRVVALTGSMSQSRRRSALAEIASGAAGIVIGTHALLSEQVQFADLGLVVVDEQHRFGVEQRDVLRAKGRTSPHLLVMTATPIPRTVAMTIFGDLETSTLRDVPAGRAEVTSFVIDARNSRWMDRMWQRAAEEVGAGHRVFVVCPRISSSLEEPGNLLYLPGVAPDEVRKKVAEEREENDDGELSSVEDVARELGQRSELAGIRIGSLHGRMPAEDKESAMEDFRDGQVPILVCTTVIEVGVDVPDASVMIILDADRFGLSQLHQLRGRIGRGTVPGICFAVTRTTEGTPARERLDAFAGTRDGFDLAEADLEQRREGDVLGAAQHGRHSGLRLLRVVTDQKIIERAREAARAIVEADPDLTENGELAAAIDRALAGEREDYLDRS